MNTATTKQASSCTFYRNQPIRYRFLYVRGSKCENYCISIKYGRESGFATLPQESRKEAYEAFLKIKRGLVTPTALSDVIEDMKY